MISAGCYGTPLLCLPPWSPHLPRRSTSGNVSPERPTTHDLPRPLPLPPPRAPLRALRPPPLAGGLGHHPDWRLNRSRPEPLGGIGHARRAAAGADACPDRADHLGSLSRHPRRAQVVAQTRAALGRAGESLQPRRRLVAGARCAGRGARRPERAAAVDPAVVAVFGVGGGQCAVRGDPQGEPRLQHRRHRHRPDPGADRLGHRLRPGRRCAGHAGDHAPAAGCTGRHG